MPEGAFDKDFGYLMPFLDKIAAAGEAISDPSAREEYKQLVSGQKERWIRIRQLLSGETKPTSQIVEKAITSNPQSTDSTEQAAQEPAREQFQFTVGSLRPGRR